MPTKRNRGDIQTAELGPGVDTEGLSDYEIRRLKIMARNRQRLVELGLEKAVEDLAALQQVPQRHKRSPAKRKPLGRAHPAEMVGPVRRSSRLQQQREGGPPAAPLVRLEQEPPAKKKRTPTKPGKSEEEKLAELEVSGLVEATDQHAVFIVLGSTGNHYRVTLSNEKQTCQCMDYRIRHRQCKHQRLVLNQLGIADNPQRWHEAVVDQVENGG